MKKPELVATFDHVICIPIRQTTSSGDHGSKIHIPESVNPRLPLVRVKAIGPECCSYVPGDVAVLLKDPATVDPTKEFSYGEIDWEGQRLWIFPESCLGPVVKNPEDLLEGMTEGLSEGEAKEIQEAKEKAIAEMRKAASEPHGGKKILVPRHGVKRN